MPEILHLTTRDAWQRDPSSPYTDPSLQSEGFIHCSLPAQVIATAHRHHRGRTDLVLLRIDPALLSSTVVHEDTSGRGVFPHVYGPIDREAVAVKSVL